MTRLRLCSRWAIDAAGTASPRLRIISWWWISRTIIYIATMRTILISHFTPYYASANMQMFALSPLPLSISSQMFDKTRRSRKFRRLMSSILHRACLVVGYTLHHAYYQKIYWSPPRRNWAHSTMIDVDTGEILRRWARVSSVTIHLAKTADWLDMLNIIAVAHVCHAILWWWER